MVRGAGCGRLLVQQPLPIGSIDLLLPKKTHRRSGASRLRPGGPLELLGGPIAQRRMQTAAVVVALDEVLDVRAQVIEILIIVDIDLLPLERLDEALTTGIVVGVRRPTHAGDRLLAAQAPHVGAGSVLHTAIGVMDQAGRRLPFGHRLLQCRQRQAGGQRSLQRPAHHLPRVGVQDHGQINELGLQPDVGDVGHPQLIDPGQLDAGG